MSLLNCIQFLSNEDLDEYLLNVAIVRDICLFIHCGEKESACAEIIEEHFMYTVSFKITANNKDWV